MPRALVRWGIPLAVTALLWLTRSNKVAPEQVLLALFLIYIPWHAYLGWKATRKTDLPVFSMISFMYWLFYAVPLFWEEHTVNEAYMRGSGRDLSEASVTLALIMVALGVGSLWLGMHVRVGQFFAPRHLSINLAPSRRLLIQGILAAGCLLNLYDISPYTLGEGGRQFISMVVSVVPMLAFVIIFRDYLRHDSSHLDRILIATFVATRFFNGLSSGWLGVSMSLIIVCGVVYLAERRKIPQVALVLVVLFILFFQVGKDDFRETYWKESQVAAEVVNEGKTERAAFWVQRSLEKWSQTLSDLNVQTVRDALIPSVSRISLLNQTANVLDLTPSVVPYQYGQLYSYMAVTLIPRFLWPEKPSVNEANQFYQVAYRLTPADELDRVSISAGTLTEGYINFSWPGALGIMLLLGIFFDFYQATFLSSKAGPLLQAVGIVVMPTFLGIESQLAQYLGGIIQEVAIILLVLLPLIRVRGLRSRRAGKPLRILHGRALLTPK